ncbi:MAG: hypothetical protein AAGM22_07985 [Acidobacteriota bacterium]
MFKRHTPFLMLLLPLLIAFAPGYAEAQSDCDPGFGLSGSEICLVVQTDPPTQRRVFRGSSPQSTGMIVVGDHEVNMTARYIQTAFGMEVVVSGTVERISAANPLELVRVDVEGGRGPTPPSLQGGLFLTGAATGAAEVQTGGSAGSPWPFDPAFLQHLGYPVVLKATTFGPASFSEADPMAGLMPPGAETVRVHNVFHIVDVGTMVDIPAGAGLGEPVFPPSADRQIVLRLPVGPKQHHFPFEQFRVLNRDTCPLGDFYALREDLDFAESLEGAMIKTNADCGFGAVRQVQMQAVGVLDGETHVEESLTIPAGEALFVPEGSHLILEEGTTLSIAQGASLTILGEASILGQLAVDKAAVLDNRGQLRTHGRVDNRGFVGNCDGAYFENIGFFYNARSATLGNLGELSNPGYICNHGIFMDKGSFEGHPVDPICDEDDEEPTEEEKRESQF